MAQGFNTTLRHHFNGQAAIEIRRGLLPFLEIGLLAINQRTDECLVLARGPSGS